MDTIKIHARTVPVHLATIEGTDYVVFAYDEEANVLLQSLPEYTPTLACKYWDSEGQKRMAYVVGPALPDAVPSDYEIVSIH